MNEQELGELFDTLDSPLAEEQVRRWDSGQAAGATLVTPRGCLAADRRRRAHGSLCHLVSSHALTFLTS